MWTYNNLNELYHYGVIGMRWGRRRGQSSQDHITSRTIGKKKLHEMSNNEIRELTNRQTLEGNYKRLNPNALKQGWLIIGSTLAIMKTINELKDNGSKINKLGINIVDKFKEIKIPKMK